MGIRKMYNTTLDVELLREVNYHRPRRWLFEKTTTSDNVIRCRLSRSLVGLL